MGCGNSNKISFPIISAPKWKEDQKQEEKKRVLIIPIYYLLSEQFIIKIQDNIITTIPHNLNLKECGVVFYPPDNFFCAGGTDEITGSDLDTCYINVL